MKAIVIYDSNFGNTKKVAEAIATELLGDAISVNDVNENTLIGIDLLIVGSPINAWRPTPKIKSFLDLLKDNKLANVKAAAFDTRVKIFISGNAAKKISKALERAGATIIMPPQGFYVKGNEGPLSDGELDNSKSWAKQILFKL